METANEDNLVYRLRVRAQIRRQNSERKSVQEGKPDRIAAILDEAADRIEDLENLVDDYHRDFVTHRRRGE